MLKEKSRGFRVKRLFLNATSISGTLLQVEEGTQCLTGIQMTQKEYEFSPNLFAN